MTPLFNLNKDRDGNNWLVFWVKKYTDPVTPAKKGMRFTESSPISADDDDEEDDDTTLASASPPKRRRANASVV